MYTTLIHWVYGLSPSLEILNSRKYKVTLNSSTYFFSWGQGAKRVGTSHLPEEGNTSHFWNFIFSGFLKFRTTNKVHKQRFRQIIVLELLQFETMLYNNILQARTLLTLIRSILPKRWIYKSYISTLTHSGNISLHISNIHMLIHNLIREQQICSFRL
jgi:hypothetical protein